MSRARITSVIATSPIPTIPEISHIRRTVESFALVPELAESPILIVFDAPNDNQPNSAYEQYKRNVTNYCRGRANIELLHLEEWGHLSGVMERAVEVVDTPFLFVQQHDLPLIRDFELDKVIGCLTTVQVVKHVRLNRRHNRPVGWDRTPLFAAYETPYLSLTRTGCWSDQSHLTTCAYYRHIVLPRIHGKRIFPESALNQQMKTGGEMLIAAHQRLGTFIYGPPGNPPVITHTDARNVGTQSDTCQSLSRANRESEGEPC